MLVILDFSLVVTDKSCKNILNPVLFYVDRVSMEIISFVNQQPERNTVNFFKNTLGSLNLALKEKKSRAKDVSFAVAMPGEYRTFRAGKVRQPLSFKTFLIALGAGLTSTGSFVKRNFLKLLISFAVAALLGTGIYFFISYTTYKQNHIGPVTFETTDSIDIDALNSIMAAFALDTPAVDEFGNLIGEEIFNSAELFTQPVSYQTYKVVAGDTISGIAKKFGLSNISTLISVNNIENVRFLAAGQKLTIPSMDGIYYTVQKGDSLNSIVEKNKIKMETLLDVNELTSEVLSAGQKLFLPGVGLDSSTLRNAMGELFRLPIKAKFRWTSPYGNRIDPIKNIKSFHTGTDMACPTGTPIYAAMSGRVTFTGVSSVFGNYVIIDHGNGYQTLYAHMSKITATKGQMVTQNTKIGLVGSTGYSTGPHLHFTVYKNGKTVNPMTVLK